MKEIFLKELPKYCKHSEKNGKISGKTKISTIAFFDMSDSTKVKVNMGHTLGSRMVLIHNNLCKIIIKKYKGKIIKELGDGILCIFDNPIQACLAALNAKKAFIDNYKFATKIAICVGNIEIIRTIKSIDIIGTSIDLCSRIVSLAKPNQIIIDITTKNSIESILKDYTKILLSKSAKVELKDYGSFEVLELTEESLGFSGPTTHDFFLDTVEISTVQQPNFPDGTNPEKWLICDTCGEYVSPKNKGGILVFDEDNNGLNKVYLFHKGECDKKKDFQWRDLGDLINPENYVQFIMAIFNKMEHNKLIVKDAMSLNRILVGLYKYVFRKSTESEHLDFVGEMQLRQQGI